MHMHIEAISFVLQVDSLASCVGASYGDGVSDSDISSGLVAPIESVGASDPSASLELKKSSKQYFTVKRSLLGSGFTTACLLCRRDPPRATSYTETEKDTQDSSGRHQDQARCTCGESHGKC